MKQETSKLRESWNSSRRDGNAIRRDSNIVKHPFKNKLFGYNSQESHGYEMRNSSAFRCEEFTREHEGKHILFTGCSVTFGVGLELKEIWAHKLYSKISKKEKVSGYYNLGVPGTGLFFIVSNLFKYFNNYGNPDVIFLNLPDLLRFYNVQDFDEEMERPYVFKDLVDILSKKVYHDQNWESEQGGSFFATWVNCYDYLIMLESYCKTNNIKLFIFTYAASTNETLSKLDLQSFYDIDPTKIIDMLIEYAADNKIDKYFLTARDGAHEGHGLHTRWAEKMFDLYTEESNVN
jgi:hypothetical protein